MWRAVIAILLMLSSSPAAASTTHTIADDPGGIVVAFIAKYWQWYEAGDQVRIEGRCVSACTLVLAFLPNDRVCATRNAEFGFHSASLGPEGPYSEEGTQMLWMFYKDRTARVLAKHGWEGPSDHPELLYIDAQEFVRPCKWEDYHDGAQ